MKKVLMLILICCVAFCVGCDGNNPSKQVVNQNKVNEVENMILMLPDVSKVQLSDEELIASTRAMYDALNDDEKALVTNYDVLTNIESALQALKDESTKRLEAIDYVKEYLQEIIPSEATEDIVLPLVIDCPNGISARVGWNSDKPEIINIAGELHRSYNDEVVTLTANITVALVFDSIELKVNVPKVELRDISKGKVVIAYLTNYNYKPFDETDMNTIDIVDFCFASIDPETFAIDMSGVSRIKEVTEMRNHGVRVMVSFGGYGAEGTRYSNAAATKEGRETLAKNMVDMVIKYQIDGIDLDWEYPGYETGRDTSVDRPNYTELVKEIHRQLKAANPNYLLSAALPGGPWGPERYELEKLNDYFDYINLMTYDLDDRGSLTHHTALFDSEYTVSQCSCDASVKIYTSRGIDSKKLVLGAAFYGRIYEAGSYAPKATPTKKGETIFYTKIYSDYISRLGGEVQRYWDDQAKAPYLYDSKNKQFISYDDEQSIDLKCKYVIDNNLGGIMFWEYGEDGSHTLIKAIVQNSNAFRASK